MEKILQKILDKLDTLDHKVSSMDERITSLEQSFPAELKKQGDLLHHLINTVAATNVKISETNERIDSVETKVDTIAEDVKEIKNSMATKHDLEFYDQMISEHSREIYKLKNN
ncbi:hypothetical protein J1P26_14570 [Neobacillus sp. MM2021_6]|uniref:hypothetical protein n=1 Tax=Bacillaceae TaxID=186817 RepID=UPI00140C02B5|nr:MULTISPECIES: hypothetical protein [Bacillaceae]MBO0960922.1 hypothetical protein [Neobacillus sp. MM2021_6]NHC20772.1 hypothetical protein [Bacillus sp. MM2020_4]